MRKGLQIMSDVCHILSQYYDTLPSDRRRGKSFHCKEGEDTEQFFSNVHQDYQQILNYLNGTSL